MVILSFSTLYVYVYMCVDVYIYIHIYVNIYVYKYIYIYTHTVCIYIYRCVSSILLQKQRVLGSIPGGTTYLMVNPPLVSQLEKNYFEYFNRAIRFRLKH